MSQHRVLVVGGGFLGYALARGLNKANYNVTVLSPRVEPSQNSDELAFRCGRQEDQKLVSALIRDHSVVIHTAWGTTPSSSAGRPAVELASGLAPCLAFLEILRTFPPARLLFLSSGGTVYGNPERLPVAESAPLQPLSCHGAGKTAAELFLLALGSECSKAHIVIRPSNVYGPGQSYRAGFGALRHLLQCAADNKPFALCGDGSQVRDYLYIGDFVDAVVQLVKRPQLTGAYNIGRGSGTALNELIALVEHTTGRLIRIDPHPARHGDVQRIVLDPDKIRRATGWAPKTPLPEGVARTWQWLQTKH